MPGKLFTILLLLISVNLKAQVCTLQGQTPATAFPICGNGTINQPNLPACRNNSVFVPGCTDSRTNYGDNNPTYYRFTCFVSGSFAFSIIPVNLNDDYDWQLFDITGHNPDDIYRDKTLIITGNWSGSLGPTGASANGVNFIQCRSNPLFSQTPTFSTMPQLIAGHDYLLLIGHAEEILNGFSLSVGGGTADITNTASQQIKANVAACDNKQVTILFSKKMRCSSIAPDGSDFILSPAMSGIISAIGLKCSNSFDTDSIIVTFNNPLSAGNYSLLIINGNDGNTLLDNCNNAVTNNTTIPFGVFPFAVFDSILPSTCQPVKLSVLLKKDILCNSVSADGSDFIISGPGPVLISNATVFCNNSISNRIELSLQQPITTPGNYTLTLKNGTDGNTLKDACNNLTPPGSIINFIIKDTVNADFAYTFFEGCKTDTVVFLNEGKIGINQWYWSFENKISTLQNPTITYTTGGNKIAELIVSNGLCSDTVQHIFNLKEKLKVDFRAPLTSCPGEEIIFKDNSSNAVNWLWNFSNGNSSTLQSPLPQQYPLTGTEKNYAVSLTVQNGNCIDSTSKIIIIKFSCIIVVPTAFTPNGDGLNDSLGPLNSSTVGNLEFSVYNRYGQHVFKSSGSKPKWDGTINNEKQPSGIYTWLLKYTDPVSGKKNLQKGVALLIR